MEEARSDWIYPYAYTKHPFDLQHVHLFASDQDASIQFYEYWFDAKVIYDGKTAGARNVFMKIGLGALHFYDQPPKPFSENAAHHLGMQVVGLDDLYTRMKKEGLNLPNPIRRFGRQADSGGYFMFEAPDGVLLEVFEPGLSKFNAVREYYGFDQVSRQKSWVIGSGGRTHGQDSGCCSPYAHACPRLLCCRTPFEFRFGVQNQTRKPVRAIFET